MRFVVFLLGLIGVIITASVGWFYFEDSLSVNVSAFAPDALREFAIPLTASPFGTANGDTGVFVLLSGAYGLLGVVFAFARCGWQGALLMIVPPLATVLINPYSLAFTSVQIFVGLLAFFVFPLPLESPKDNRGDRDEGEPKAKPKAKSKRQDEDDE